MKKFNELKPYYMSLKPHPEAAPMKINAIILLHGVVLFLAVLLVSIFPNVKTISATAIYLVIVVAYVIYAAKNEKALDGSYTARMTFAVSLCLGMACLSVVFLMARTTVSVLLLTLVFVLLFLLGAVINYIVAVRYVKKFNNGEIAPKKTVSQRTYTTMAMVISMLMYPMIRILKPSEKMIANILFFMIMAVAAMAGYFSLAVIGRIHFERSGDES